MALIEDDRRAVHELRRASGSVGLVHDAAVRDIVQTIPSAARSASVSEPTAAKALAHLEQLQIMHEITGRQRGRVYVYRRYLDILQEGTEQ